MNQQEAREAVDKGLAQLADQLDAGRSPAMMNYLAAMARFHKYSWGNQILLFTQDPEATRVAGYQTWRDMGRQVVKGARGLMILAPMCARAPRAEPDEGKEGDEANRTQPRARFFKPVRVFDVRLTIGEDLPEPPRVQGDPGLAFRHLEALAMDDYGIRVDFVASLGGALGQSLNGRIEIVRDLPPAVRYTTLAHELAHEILHWSVPEEVRRDQALVETEAEAVAFILTLAAGLEPGTASSDYIGLYNGNREVLRTSLASIHRAAAPMLKAVLSPPGEGSRAPAVGAGNEGETRRGVHTGSPLSLCRKAPTNSPAIGSFVQVRDVPAEAAFIADTAEVRRLNVEYARRSDAYDAFFVMAGDGEILAVWGMRGIVPWADRETVLLHDARRP